MCCLFTAIVLVGPRLGIVIWGFAQPARWELTFDTFVWPLLGFVLVPWTTLMYVVVAPGGVNGLDWLWIGMAFVTDIASYSGGAYGNRDRLNRYGTPSPV